MLKRFVLMVCGPPGSGKTTLGRAVAAEMSGRFVEASTVVKRLFSHERDGDETYMEYVARMFRSGGASHFASAIAAECAETEGFVVLSGLRHVDEVTYLRHAVGRSVVVYLECPEEIRRQRKPLADPVVQIGIETRDRVERSWGAGEIASVADFIVSTEGAVQDSLQAIRNIVRAAANDT